MKLFGCIALAALVVQLFGCVSGQDAKTDEVVTPKADPADTVADTASIDETPAPAEAALAGEASLDWQKTLTDDVNEVETKGNAFLEASFRLYDQLLDEAAGTPQRQAQINTTLKESVGLYAELTGAVDRLRIDLDKPDLKEALPLKGDEGKREFEAVSELFQTYKRAEAHEVAYDGTSGASVTMLLFNDKNHGEGSGLDGLPKPQRDALLLLDYLRSVSNDLAYVSHTVTDWVDVRKNLGTVEEEYAH